MSTQLWRQSGKIIINGDGVIVTCAVDPCLLDVRPCILERQKVAGISTAWDDEDPTNTDNLIGLAYDYSLAELKAYVADLIQAGIDNNQPYISGTYSGGTSGPTKLTSSYADGATTVGELLALLVAMQQTAPDLTWSDDDYWSGRTTTSQSTWADAKTVAEADWGGPGSGGGGPFEYTSGSKTSGGLFNAQMWHGVGRATATALTTAIAKTTVFWARIGTWAGTYESAVFDSQGSGPTEGQGYYHQFDSQPSDSIATTDSALVHGDVDDMPPNWCSEPANNGDDYVKGWYYDLVLAVQTWAFDYV